MAKLWWTPAITLLFLCFVFLSDAKRVRRSCPPTPPPSEAPEVAPTSCEAQPSFCSDLAASLPRPGITLTCCNINNNTTFICADISVSDNNCGGSGIRSSGGMEKSYQKYVIREAVPTPSKAVLLVIDMQEHFRAVAAPIFGPIRRSIEACRGAGIPVVFTQHRHKGLEDEGMLRVWWGQDLILADTPAAELLPEVSQQPGDKLVRKHTYSAFHDTDLEQWLRKSGKTELIVTGVMTNLCCETTARDAFVKGFRVFFSTDATATANSELHAATLKNMAYGFAYLVDAHSLQANLGSPTR